MNEIVFGEDSHDANFCNKQEQWSENNKQGDLYETNDHKYPHYALSLKVLLQHGEHRQSLSVKMHNS